MGWWRVAVQMLMRKVLLQQTVLLVMRKGGYLLERRCDATVALRNLPAGVQLLLYYMIWLLLAPGLVFVVRLCSCVCWPTVKYCAGSVQVSWWPSSIYHIFCVWQVLCSTEWTQEVYDAQGRNGQGGSLQVCN